VWFSFWGDKRCRPAYLDICGQIDAERLNEFERLCRLIRKEGGYSHADPVLVAKSLQSLIDGIWLNKLCQPELYLRGEARRMCVSFLAGWFPNHFSPKGEYSAE
jgi:TetR/AcrR family transcriptional repressor of bet genes